MFSKTKRGRRSSNEQHPLISSKYTAECRNSQGKQGGVVSWLQDSVTVSDVSAVFLTEIESCGPRNRLVIRLRRDRSARRTRQTQTRTPSRMGYSVRRWRNCNDHACDDTIDGPSATSLSVVVVDVGVPPSCPAVFSVRAQMQNTRNRLRKFRGRKVSSFEHTIEPAAVPR